MIAAYLTMGQSIEGRLLAIAHEDRAGGRIRIISARRATRAEARAYQEG